jgi:hypothetical protein
VFKSKVMDTDEKFSYTFTKPGNFPYFCSLHSKMTGKVVVQWRDAEQLSEANLTVTRGNAREPVQHMHGKLRGPFFTIRQCYCLERFRQEETNSNSIAKIK